MVEWHCWFPFLSTLNHLYTTENNRNGRMFVKYNVSVFIKINDKIIMVISWERNRNGQIKQPLIITWNNVEEPTHTFIGLKYRLDFQLKCELFTLKRFQAKISFCFNHKVNDKWENIILLAIICAPFIPVFFFRQQMQWSQSYSMQSFQNTNTV